MASPVAKLMYEATGEGSRLQHWANLRCRTPPNTRKHGLHICLGKRKRGAHVGGHREGLLLASEAAVRAEDDGAAALVLVQEGAVGEVVDEAGLALDARVADVAHLLAVELLPLLGVEALVQRRYVLWQHLQVMCAERQDCAAICCEGGDATANYSSRMTRLM